jgi:hypothetical protein
MPDKPCKHSFELVYKERHSTRESFVAYLFCRNCGTGKKTVIQ